MLCCLQGVTYLRVTCKGASKTAYQYDNDKAGPPVALLEGTFLLYDSMIPSKGKTQYLKGCK